MRKQNDENHDERKTSGYFRCYKSTSFCFHARGARSLCKLVELLGLAFPEKGNAISDKKQSGNVLRIKETKTRRSTIVWDLSVCSQVLPHLSFVKVLFTFKHRPVLISVETRASHVNNNIWNFESVVHLTESRSVYYNIKRWYEQEESLVSQWRWQLSLLEDEGKGNSGTVVAEVGTVNIDTAIISHYYILSSRNAGIGKSRANEMAGLAKWRADERITYTRKHHNKPGPALRILPVNVAKRCLQRL